MADSNPTKADIADSAQAEPTAAPHGIDSAPEPVVLEHPSDISEAETVTMNAPVPDAPSKTAKPEKISRKDLPPPNVRQASAVPLVVGGLIAAAFGFALAQIVPNGWPVGGNPTVLSAMQADISAEKARGETLAAAISALDQKIAAMPPADSALPDQIAAMQAAAESRQTALDAKIAELANASAALDGRVVVLERRPVGGGAASDTALSAYETEIQTLRDMVEAQQKQSESAGADIAAIAATAKAEVEAAEQRALALRTDAERTAGLALGRAAAQRVRAALETGAAFGTALEDLAAAGITVPPELAAQSAGVATLQAVQAGFADPARAALSASLKATVGDGAMARLGSFLRNQVGARSLTAKDGMDPDAILSRAGAAAQAGDLAAALTEILQLPEAGQAALGDWVGLANARLVAVAATEALMAGLDN